MSLPELPDGWEWRVHTEWAYPDRENLVVSLWDSHQPPGHTQPFKQELRRATEAMWALTEENLVAQVETVAHDIWNDLQLARLRTDWIEKNFGSQP